MSGGIEIHPINDAFEERVGVGDGTQVRRELLPYFIRERAYN